MALLSNFTFDRDEYLSQRVKEVCILKKSLILRIIFIAFGIGIVILIRYVLVPISSFHASQFAVRANRKTTSAFSRIALVSYHSSTHFQMRIPWVLLQAVRLNDSLRTLILCRKFSWRYPKIYLAL